MAWKTGVFGAIQIHDAWNDRGAAPAPPNVIRNFRIAAKYYIKLLDIVGIILESRKRFYAC